MCKESDQTDREKCENWLIRGVKGIHVDYSNDALDCDVIEKMQGLYWKQFHRSCMVLCLRNAN